MFRTALALASSVAALAAAPAAAQSAPYFSASKTEAILGGASSLQAILAQQSGGAVAPAAAALPANYGIEVRPAAIRLERPPISDDRPDVFNSVALEIGHTSLERRWRKVAGLGVGGASAAYAARLAGQSPIDRLRAINSYVNARVRFVDDIRQYGVADRWTAASDTLRRGRGDCEDYAIAKLQLLRRAGFAERDLYLVILHDTLRRADHAVLVVRSEGRMLVLDNGTDRLTDSYEMSDYRPIITFSGQQAWTHGYRRVMPQIELASNQAGGISVATAAAVAPSAQR